MTMFDDFNDDISDKTIFLTRRYSWRDDISDKTILDDDDFDNFDDDDFNDFNDDENDDFNNNNDFW